MCRLLGLSFNVPISPIHAYSDFRKKGTSNPDGWGIAYYKKDGNVFLDKDSDEPGHVSRSIFKILVRDDAISKTFLFHLRHGSDPQKCNCHPFTVEEGGKHFTFAHNGTLHNYQQLPIGSYKKESTKDSEHFFLYMMTQPWNGANFQILADFLNKWNKELGKLNACFSDGHYLFCYRSMVGHKHYVQSEALEWKDQLLFARRSSPFPAATVEADGVEKILSEVKSDAERGYVIATEPVTKTREEEWYEFMPGELIVFEDGEMKFSNKRDVNNPLQDARKYDGIKGTYYHTDEYLTYLDEKKKDDET